MSRPARPRLLSLTAAAAALALLAGGCGTQGVVPPCPGAVVGTFRFTGTQVAGTGCLFDPKQGEAEPHVISFTAQVAFGDAGEAWVCRQEADAAPLAGTHDGDHLAVRGGAMGVEVSGCTCKLNVAESLEGDLTRDGGGAASGFTAGLLRDDISGPPPWVGVVEPSPPADQCEAHALDPTPRFTCGVPCTTQWVITGAP